MRNSILMIRTRVKTSRGVFNKEFVFHSQIVINAFVLDKFIHVGTNIQTCMERINCVKIRSLLFCHSKAKYSWQSWLNPSWHMLRSCSQARDCTGLPLCSNSAFGPHLAWDQGSLCWWTLADWMLWILVAMLAGSMWQEKRMGCEERYSSPQRLSRLQCCQFEDLLWNAGHIWGCSTFRL